MHCSIFLRDPDASDHWILSETTNVSAAGAYFDCDVELPPDRTVEYVLTFPPEWTHAVAPWGVRFQGNVVRVEPHTEAYGVAVHTSKRRYLSAVECNGFSGMDEMRTVSQAEGRIAPRGKEE
jgi:hypothetical protein